MAGNAHQRPPPHTTLRRRILFSILPAALITVAAMSAWHYQESKQQALQYFSEVQKDSESEVVNALRLMDAGYRMLENRLEREMRQQLPILLSAYEKSGHNPAKMDLAALKQRIGTHLDIYIIDANAVVRWSSDPKGIDFDFKSYGLGPAMQSIRSGNKIVNERIRTNVLSGRLGDWIYTPTPDHRYIIEIGYGSSAELGHIAGDLDPIKAADNLEQLSPYVQSVRIFDVFGYEFGHTDEADYAPDPAIKKHIAQVMKQGRELIDNGDDTLTLYRYVDLAALKPSVSNPGKIIRIDFTRQPIAEQLASEARDSLIALLLFAVVLAATILLLSRRLTRPLRKLHRTAQAVTDGDLSQRANVLARDETGELASAFNAMLDRISSHEAALEITVEQRTRDLQLALKAQVKAEKNQLHMQELALNAQHMEGLGKVASGVAHQFNNIMVSIMGNAELIEMQKELPKEIRTYAQRILEGSERGAHLTQQLLAYTGKGRIDIDTLQPAEALKSVLAVARAELPSHGHLESAFDDDTPAIRMDVGQFQQLVLALISNASKAIADQGGWINVHTSLAHLDAHAIHRLQVYETMMPGDFLCLTVEDDGCGMNDDTRRQMFDPFFTRVPTDAGLGLSALHGIVRNVGGGIDVESALNSGTTVHVYLPVTTQAPAKAPIPSGDETQGNFALVADDEPTTLEVAAGMLEHCGFSVLTAGNGEEAIRLFEENRESIGVVILDMQMPRMNGEDALIHIRAMDRHVPIWLCSGFDEERVASRLYKKGLTGFIAKPYRFAEFSHCVCENKPAN